MLDDVDTLMKMVNRNGVQEVEIESKGLKVRVRGKASVEGAVMGAWGFPVAHGGAAGPTGPTGPTGAVGVAAGVAPAPSASAKPEAAPVEAKANLIEIKSPMVGTFYRAPAPDAPPYAEVGDRITEETVLCIVEAMKLMNEIKAETAGIVAEILVENGHPVEFGQPLFRIEPSE